MTLLQQRDAARAQRRLDLCSRTRHDLRIALSELVPGREVLIFGSLTKPGVFNDCSDIDVALLGSPGDLDPCSLAGELSDRLRRPVDVIWVDRCRFRNKILSQGEHWTA